MCRTQDSALSSTRNAAAATAATAATSRVEEHLASLFAPLISRPCFARSCCPRPGPDNPQGSRNTFSNHKQNFNSHWINFSAPLPTLCTPRWIYDWPRVGGQRSYINSNRFFFFCNAESGYTGCSENQSNFSWLSIITKTWHPLPAMPG